MENKERNIQLLPAYDYSEEIGSLFTEYTAMLIEGDPEIKKYLEIQNYEEERKHLKMKYGLPNGRLYIVFCDGKPAGCIGLRKLDEERCEMKRLYVRPEFRGCKIGDLLIQKILDDAKEIGYKEVLLDTLPFLQSAIHMYYKYGFYEIGSYNDSPMDTSIYMRREL